jgi:PKD repeat protein
MKTIATFLILLISTHMTFSQYFNAIRFRINGNGYSDETIIRMLNGATPEFDGNYDAYKLFSLNPNVPSIFTKTSNQEDLSINSVNLLQVDSIITVYVNIPASGNYTLNIENVYPFDSNYKLSFSDLIQNTHYFISGDTTIQFNFAQPGDSIAAFSFNISTPLSVNSLDETCAGLKNGSLTVFNPGNNDWECSIIAENGNESTGLTVQNEMISLTNLAPDNYTIISHWRGIKDTVTTTVNAGIMVKANFELTNDTVYLTNNVASVNALNNSTNASDFIWDFGNGNSSTNSNPVIEYFNAGNYTITLIASNGNCMDTTVKSVTILDNISTGIASLPNTNIKLATLSYNNYKIISNEKVNTLEIYDINGRLINSTTSTTFTLQDYASGQYIVKVNLNNQQTQIFRLIRN